MDAGNHVRPRQHQDVVVAFQILRMVLEALAAEIRLAQLVPLDHGAHRAIEYEDPFSEQTFECVDGSHESLLLFVFCYSLFVIRYFLVFARFVPIASRTANGSFVRRAPSATLMSVKPARVSMPDRCSSLKPNQRSPSFSRTQVSSCGRRSRINSRPPGVRIRDASS